MSEPRPSQLRQIRWRRLTDQQLQAMAAAMPTGDLRRRLDRIRRGARFSSVLPFVPVGLSVSGGVIAATAIAMTSGPVKGGQWSIVVVAAVVGFAYGAWSSRLLGAEVRRVHAIYEAELSQREDVE